MGVDVQNIAVGAIEDFESMLFLLNSRLEKIHQSGDRNREGKLFPPHEHILELRILAKEPEQHLFIYIQSPISYTHNS